MLSNGRPNRKSRRAQCRSPKTASLFENDATAHHEIDREILSVLPQDRWLLSSLLQKSIRRGRSDYAAAAAVALADFAPEYVARRLPVIAYEDIGVAAPDLLLWSKHTAASLPLLPRDDRRRVAALISRRLANSIKSRTACDIVSLLEASEEAPGQARDLIGGRVEDWIAVAADRDLPVIRRAVALRLVLGLSVRGVRPTAVAHDKPNVLPALATAMRLPASVVAAVHAGRQTHNMNSALPLAHDLLRVEGQPVIKTQPNLTKQAAESHGLLLCAVDMFTRCGRTAYRMLARGNSDLSGMFGRATGNADPASVIGILQFHAEGSLLDRTLVSPASATLLATVEAAEARHVGLKNERDVKSLRQWLRRNADLVDRARADVLRQTPPATFSNGTRRKSDPESWKGNLD